MFVLKRLIRKGEMGRWMNCERSRPIRIQEVTALDHEVFDLL